MKNDNHKGSIYLRKDGVYGGSVMYNGIRKNFYSKDKKIVQEKIDKYINDLKYHNVTSHSMLLFSDYVNDFLFTYKYGFIKDSSFDRLETVMRCQIKGSDIDISLYLLDDVIIQNYLNKQAHVLSGSTLKKLYQLVKLVLSYAYKKKDIDIDYSGLLVLPHSTKKVKSVEIYTDEEVDILVKHIECCVSKIDSNNALYRLYRYSLGYLIILNMGFRAGELLALTWNDVDLVNCMVHVENTLSHVRNRNGDTVYTDVITPCKTVNSIRDIPINKNALRYFVFLRSIDNYDNFVITSPDGNFLKLRNFQQTFKRICFECGVPYKGLHSLRHTFASRLIDRGVSAKCVSDLLGHSSVVFTMNRYVHSCNNNLSSAVDKLN